MGLRRACFRPERERQRGLSQCHARGAGRTERGGFVGPIDALLCGGEFTPHQRRRRPHQAWRGALPGVHDGADFGRTPVGQQGLHTAMSIEDPAEYAARSLRAMLLARGVQVSGKARAQHRQSVDTGDFLSANRPPSPFIPLPSKPSSQPVLDRTCSPRMFRRPWATIWW